MIRRLCKLATRTACLLSGGHDWIIWDHPSWHNKPTPFLCTRCRQLDRK